MIAKSVRIVKGRGLVVEVDKVPGCIHPGDNVACDNEQWTIEGIKRGAGSSVILRGPKMPKEGDNLAWIPGGGILDKPLRSITLRQFLEAFERTSKERQELAGVLSDLRDTINYVELKMGHDEEIRREALKTLRDTFNQIPPKWFHR